MDLSRTESVFQAFQASQLAEKINNNLASKNKRDVIIRLKGLISIDKAIETHFSSSEVAFNSKVFLGKLSSNLDQTENVPVSILGEENDTKIVSYLLCSLESLLLPNLPRSLSPLSRISQNRKKPEKTPITKPNKY